MGPGGEDVGSDTTGLNHSDVLSQELRGNRLNNRRQNGGVNAEEEDEAAQDVVEGNRERAVHRTDERGQDDREDLVGHDAENALTQNTDTQEQADDDSGDRDDLEGARDEVGHGIRHLDGEVTLLAPTVHLDRE